MSSMLNNTNERGQTKVVVTLAASVKTRTTVCISTTCSIKDSGFSCSLCMMKATWGFSLCALCFQFNYRPVVKSPINLILG